MQFKGIYLLYSAYSDSLTTEISVMYGSEGVKINIFHYRIIYILIYLWEQGNIISHYHDCGKWIHADAPRRQDMS